MKTKRRECGKLPRVLYAVVLDPTQKFGSLEEQIIQLAYAFEANGSLFYPLFICPEGPSESGVFHEAGMQVERLDLTSFRFSRLTRLLELIDRLGITLVHWNFTDMFRNDYLWWLSVFHPKVKHCFTDHISRMPGVRQTLGVPKKFMKRLLSVRYVRVFCISQFVLDDLQRQGIRSRLTLCRCFINTDRFLPNAVMRSKMRKQFQAEDLFVLLAAAHLIKEKGIDIVIRAMELLPESVALWIVGNGKELEKLRQLSSDLNLTTRVHFFGLQRDIAPFMQAADCFVCPSLWAEAVGLVNMEASASGLPVVASRIGGIPEYVEDGRTGFLFAPGDYADLARCVQSLNSDPALYQEMSKEARDWATKRFAPDTVVPEYLNLYSSIGLSTRSI